MTVAIRLAAYVSTPHSGLPPEVRRSFEERCELIQEVCEDEHYSCHCPHHHMIVDLDAAELEAEVRSGEADVMPGESYRNAVDAIGRAELLIADCSVPAAGVGVECHIASEHGIPVLIVAQQGAIVSQMIRGLPSLIKAGSEADIVRFNDEVELGRRLRDRLIVLKEPLMMARERRNNETLSREALREYARGKDMAYARYQRLRSLVAAAVGGKFPRTVEDWEALDRP